MGTRDKIGGAKRSRPVALLLACAAFIGPRASASQHVTLAWSVGVSCDYPLAAFVQDLISSNALLLDEGCSAIAGGGKYVPTLVLRKIEDGKVVSRTPLRSWADFIQAHHLQARPGQSFLNWDPAFRSLRQPNTVLLAQVPWLAVVDLKSGLIIRSVLASPDLMDPGSPACHVAIQNPEPARVAVSPQQQYVAAAFNLGTVPRVFVFNPDLTRNLRTWTLTRYIKDVAWSPDGRRLAVLYDGRFDKDGRYVGYSPKQQWPVRLADVAVFDVGTGAEVVEYATGTPESEIAFSPDGSLIYTISRASVAGPLPGDAIRAFSSVTGKLVRTIGTEVPGLDDEFAISPDGRFIAANASTELWHPFFTEAHAFGNVSRLVVLDAATGRVVFQYQRKTSMAYPLNPHFSPDGRFLFVQFGPGRSRQERLRGMVHIVAYSLAGL